MEPTVLVVASSQEARSRIGAWLEESDLAVVTCPGPEADVPCVGMLARCPLAEAADAVVVDPSSGGQREVLDVYLQLGVGVVVVGTTSELREVHGRPEVVPVVRPAEYPTLVGAVWEALARGRSLGTG